ncbi:bifunctional ADP-dependent NAD(P)H-hydrate dehydratase/NAD(P)H-hydrate epimerase [Sphingobium sp. AP49]|uniref:bifunctional ADP-dependent NAD(P)H-hydrate dehydratase/NAD(P)H-hydrate epimerase n=1 Tax=Sphingobium sp. AP49 TaxID=1144307 RepID=UPI00026EDF50|nr:bifunctional ADP-dependent NAD(P)H-hydrate dehydratase/NAD(P)H-hydrate epimerase [Sphingobium sp. AP49]WHO37149.1 bifunctional ADP-dependent NAD(P)H-hydrate dehydratase/NAD(P)H-hydrate epimerase [Sphingobium sp. AP49]
MPGMAIVTAVGMRAAEQHAFDAGADPYELMEAAGAAAAEIIWRAGHRRDMLLMCGPGNNGGDGFVIARLLAERGVPVRVAALAESRTMAAQRARAAWPGPVEPFMDARPASQLVDALFGTGLTRGLDNAVAARLGALVAQASHSYAIDLPSGVGTDDGAILSPLPHFTGTIALGAFKPAHLLQPAAAHMGWLVCADIGIGVPDRIHELAAPHLAAPGRQLHKYSRGLVAVIGGAMPGASMLAAAAAAHAGAGMVRRYDAQPCPLGPLAIVRETLVDAGALADAIADPRIGALLIGPGLGRDGDARRRLDGALDAGRPMVIDADALSLLAEGGRMRIPAGAILTPHEGEFVRLFGDLPGSKIDRALAAAQQVAGVVVYKGADSIVASADGRAAVTRSGSSWLSTAGTGDVLAGIAAARLAVTADPFRAACEAVWLHGEAARRAGPAFVADDLLARLPAAIGSRCEPR